MPLLELASLLTARHLNPEVAHKLAVLCVKLGILKLPKPKNRPRLNTTVFGIDFQSPLGLAAGFDKNAVCARQLLSSDLGFVEFGTVTPFPQYGNYKPRIIRLPQDRAILNNMGFNGVGANRFLLNIAKIEQDTPYGINIGPNKLLLTLKDTPAAKDLLYSQIAKDLEHLFTKFYTSCGYIAVNISSPNTGGLRESTQENLGQLLSKIDNIRTNLHNKTGRYTPYLIKISPDIGIEDVYRIAEVVLTHKVDGIILTNTTAATIKYITGGLSGSPLRDISNRILREFYVATKGKIPLIGVGGIMNARHAYEKIRFGASLVQLYTCLTYKGFSAIKTINDGLDTLLKQDGFEHVSDAVGLDAWQT